MLKDGKTDSKPVPLDLPFSHLLSLFQTLTVLSIFCFPYKFLYAMLLHCWYFLVLRKFAWTFQCHWLCLFQHHILSYTNCLSSWVKLWQTWMLKQISLEWSSVIKNNNNWILHSLQPCGIDQLWKIAVQARSTEVSWAAISYLNSLYINGKHHFHIIYI